MKCPIDQTDLQMMERRGVEIDYCPKCRGIWLDRGELDKIIERSSGQSQKRSVDYSEKPYLHQKHDSHHSEEHDHDSHDHDPRRRRKGFLSDLFDF
jgi:uncharacterized protein